jgi:hypothetical protein
MLESKREADDRDGAGDGTERDDAITIARRRRIRCPKCAWQPERHHVWYCRCGHAWNTFETRGVCPACQYAWQWTACHRCHEWSPHLDWYEREPPS